MHFIQEIKMFSCHKLNNWLYIVTVTEANVNYKNIIWTIFTLYYVYILLLVSTIRVMLDL